jgi:archaellum biogenesis protein FlaJ (TadC family)
MPSAVTDNIPKPYKLMKLCFVQVKIGPQIMTLMCDKKVFNAIPTKKTIKGEIAGMYIVSFAGMKSDEEMKKIKKEKKAKEKKNK